MLTLVLYMIGFWIIAAILVAMGNYLFRWLEAPPGPVQQIDDRIYRDDELTRAYQHLEETYGREPTIRELWLYCPPA